MIPVTKPYLPNREKLNAYIDGIYERNWLTNNGPLVQELTHRLELYLGVENLLLVSNGTLALQIAYRALGINDPIEGEAAEAITTPFTFVATASSLKWEGVEPVFVDIDSGSWNLDPKNIESAITPQTRAIVPVHVFGNPCEVEAIQTIAEQHNLKVIYDAAHAFGVKYKGESILKWGDAATLSFHATKVFHTIEGGAIIFKRKEDLEKAKLLISFGISGPDNINTLGINAKMSEFNAAMGLCVLDEIEDNLTNRSAAWLKYEEILANKLQIQNKTEAIHYNYAYFPVVFESENQAKKVADKLRESGVVTRRYFYPCLSKLNYTKNSNSLSNSSLISNRVLCLPIYSTLSRRKVEKIAETILGALNEFYE